MNKIAFVADSTISMPKDYVNQHHIHIAPNIMIWSGKEYRDGVDITLSEFYSRLETEKELPTTAAVAPYAYKELFSNLLKDGFDICGVFISARMSNNYSAAQQAKELLDAENIILIDSQTAGMAAGWPLILAARAADQGVSLVECTAIIREGLANTGFIGTVDSLEHLQRSGRIGLAQSYIGSLLDVKPLLELAGGQFAPAGRARTRKKSILKLVEMTVERVNGRMPLYLAVMHANVADDAQTLLGLLQEQLEIDEFIIGEPSPNVTFHLGVGALGVNFMAGVSEPKFFHVL
jgi:DegV family protein with EDD domain